MLRVSGSELFSPVRVDANTDALLLPSTYFSMFRNTRPTNVCTAVCTYPSVLQSCVCALDSIFYMYAYVGELHPAMGNQ